MSENSGSGTRFKIENLSGSAVLFETNSIGMAFHSGSYTDSLTGADLTLDASGNASFAGGAKQFDVGVSTFVVKNGFVHVGGASDPPSGYSLRVNGAAAFDSLIAFGLTGNASYVTKASDTGDGSANDLELRSEAGGIQFNIGNAMKMYVAHAGNVGIGGVPNANATFDIARSTTSTYALRVSSNNTTTEMLVVDNLGRVGIDMTTPSYALDVTGDANVSGVYRSGGTAGVSGSNSAGNYPTMTVTNGIVTAFGSAAIPGAGSTPQPAAQGISYWLGSSSGTIIYSTGTTNTYHIADSSWVVNGSLVHTVDTAFSMGASTFSYVYLNSSGNLVQGGLTSLAEVNISSASKAATLMVALSTTNAQAVLTLIPLAEKMTGEGVGISYGGRGSGVNSITVTTGVVPDQVLACPASHNIVASCASNQLSYAPMSVRHLETNALYAGATPEQYVLKFVVNNASGSSANMACRNYTAANYQVSVDGQGLQAVAAGTSSAPVNISLSTGVHLIHIQTSGEAVVDCDLPANVNFVRGGY
jgi:hypothetical protein